MTTPVRIQRSRKKGFNLQAASPNGLLVVYVGRPTRFGNVFDWRNVRHVPGMAYCTGAEARQWVVDRYRDRILNPEPGVKVPTLEEIQTLHGKNLACFCPLDQPCHADILLELANSAQGDMARGDKE